MWWWQGRVLDACSMNLDRRLLREARIAGLWPAIAIGLGLLGGCATLLQALYLSKIIAEVFLENAPPRRVEPDLLALLLVVVLRATAIGSREVAASTVAIRVRAQLRERLLAHLFALGPIHAAGERAGELASTVHEGIEALDGYFSQYLPNLVLAAMIPTAILAFVLPVDPLSGVVLLLTAPLIPLFMILIGKRAEALTRRQWDTLSELEGHFLDVLQGLNTLKVFGRSQQEVERLALTSDRFRITTMGVLRVAFLSSLALEMISTISTAVVAVEVGLRLLYGTLAFEQALFILILAPEFYLPLRNLGAGFHAGVSGLAAAERIYEILGMDPRPVARGAAGQDSPANGDRPPSSQAQPPLPPPHLRFEDVRLAINGRIILDGVTFEVAPGEHVALVGPSGAGKSSIARLLLGFMRPDGGRILIDGRPMEEIGVEAWRQRVAWVPQDPYLFHTTVAENLRLARPGATEEEVIRAATTASVHDFVVGLPNGYETVIGEQGERLSGGQAQRLALARALLKDAGVLILDEPTSHLDSWTESSLLDALEGASDGRTVISIVHRMEAARRADRVLVLDGGQLVAAGSHADLLSDQGLYSRLLEKRIPSAEGSRGALEVVSSAPYRGQAGSYPMLPVSSSSQRASRAQQDLANVQTSSPPLSEEVGALGQLVRLASPYSGRMALSVLLGSATVGAGIGLTATAAFLIALAALHPSVAELSVPIVGVRFFGLSRGILRYLERYVSHDVTFRLLTRLKVWFFQAVEAAPPAWLMGQRPGDLLNRVIADTDTLQHFFVRALAPPLVALVVSISLLLLLAGFDPSLSRALIPFLLASGVGLPLLAARAGRRPSLEAAQLRAELSVHLVDGVRGMADLLAFGQEARFLDQARALNRRWTSTQGRAAMLSGLHAGIATLLAGMGAWTVLAVAIPLVWGGQMAGVYLPVVVMATLAGFEAVAPLPGAFQHLSASLQAGRRLFQIAGARRPGSLVEATSRLGQFPWVLHPKPTPLWTAPELIVEGLSFRYAPDGPLALDGVSFQLRSGESLAILGPSGAGKSTLANILLRLWDFEEGLILLAGRDLRSYERHELTRLMAVIPQRVHLFNGTLRENILMARPEADEGQLRRAVQMAGLEELVRRLPNGYDTKVGDLGMLLSGGERQRVAIARAFIKDSPVLILDEPTSSLDGITEREVLAALRSLMDGRTTLLITHSPAVLSMVDGVLELEQGRARRRPALPELLRPSSRPR